VIHTIIGTCRLKGIDPWKYVRDVLEKLAAGWLHSRLDELPAPGLAPASRRCRRPGPSCDLCLHLTPA